MKKINWIKGGADMAGFKYETPLRGWKEILPLMQIGDRRFAITILKKKNLLQYEGRQPVLLASEYLQTLKQK